MAKYQQIFFDLDGTLNDSAPGICRSMQFALEQLGESVPSEESLRWVVGPPIADNFRKILQTDDIELIERGIKLFRERYLPIGKFEASIYDGVHQMLQDLADYRGKMRVLTSKLEDFAIQVVEHFELAPHFSGVHGSQAHKQHHSSDSKGARMAVLLAEHQLDPAACVMVGDREYDVLAAKENGVLSIGVTYGYGSREELSAAGADVILDSPLAVAEYLLTSCV